VLKKGLKLAHWIWTISTLAIAGFWFVHHGGTNWFPVSVPVVSKAVAASVDLEVVNDPATKVAVNTVNPIDENSGDSTLATVASRAVESADAIGVELMGSSATATALHADAVSIAYQLGRLDFASVALTIIGVVFALLGVFGFMHLKDRAEFIAKKTTEECFKEYKKELTPKLEKIARAYMEEALLDMPSDYAELKTAVNSAADEESIAPRPEDDLKGAS
jgi:hypothetical protein